MVKKKINRATVILTSLLLCLIMFFGVASASIMKVFAAETSNYDTDKILYLSDTSRIEHIGNKSFSLDNSRLWMAPSQKDNIPNKAAQAKIEGAWYTFEYGVYAHASSIVTFEISNFSNKYKYFSAYVGLCNGASKSNGVLVRVDFSQDGTNWTIDPEGKTPVTTNEAGSQFVGYNQDFLHLTYDVTGVKYIRLFANNNGSNAQDQVIWTDAKLTTTEDEGGAVKSLAAYDKQIKAKVQNSNWNTSGNDAKADLFKDKDLEKLILQREFVSRVGQYALKKFISESADNKAMLDDWLLKDLDVLREFMFGGTPFKGNYYNSLTVLSNLYKSYKKDLNDKTLLSGDGKPGSGNKFMPKRTFGELCRTMMFSVALTHDGTIGSYLQASVKQNQSEPNRRYAIFKYMYQTERFVSTRNADGTWKSETMNFFGSLKVEEMRYIMCNIIDDESIIWLNDYVQTRINNAPNNVGNLHTPHSYVKYTDPNYNNPVFYAEANIEYFNALFSVDSREVKVGDKVIIEDDNAGKALPEDQISGSAHNNANITHYGLWDAKYIVPAGEGEEPYVMTVSRTAEGVAKLQKVWMNFRNKFGTGSVCGGISKSGTNIRTARGIPASVIGQPGHAAILYFSKDANGKGSWKIDNDVGGWLAATKGERHLLGWGNEAWQRNSGGTVVYFHLAQLCLDDYDNLVRAEEYCWLAKVYAGDLETQERLYGSALTAQPMNLDAWYGLTTTFMANPDRTTANFCSLVDRIANTYWNHPVAMHCLFRVLNAAENPKPEATKAQRSDAVFVSQMRTVEVNALAKAKASGSSAAKSKVNYFLGNTDTSVADFSFDGKNAGCIVWSDSYKDSGFRWRYSLDGKKTWSEEIVFTGDGAAPIYKLPDEQIKAISSDNDIYVYIVGADPNNAYKIEVSAKPALPDVVYANDWENRIIGVDKETYEWRYCEETEMGYTPVSNWRSFKEATPDCTGDVKVEVRIKGTSKNPASDSKIFTFTEDKDTADKKYISVDYLTIKEYSSQPVETDSRKNYAVNAIDGNANTYWHTDYNENIKQSTKYNATTKKWEETSKKIVPYIIIELDAPTWLSVLEFSQRQYNSAFSIFAKKVTVYTSTDGVNWTKAGERTDLENIADLNVVNFRASTYCQYVKLELTELYETNANDGVYTTVSLVNLYEDTTKTATPLTAKTPGKDSTAGFGEVVTKAETAGEKLVKDEVFEGHQATNASAATFATTFADVSADYSVNFADSTFEDIFVDISGDGPIYTSGNGKNSTNAGLVAALVIVAVVLVGGGAAAFIFIKRRKAMAGGAVADEPKPKKSATKAPKQKAAKSAATAAEKPAAPKTTQSATAKPAAKPAATTTAKPAAAAPKTSATAAPKASTAAAPKASATVAPKANATAAPKATATAAPKASATVAPKANATAAPKATATAAPKASAPAPKASATAAPKASTAAPKASAPAPKTSTTNPKASTIKPKTK